MRKLGNKRCKKELENKLVDIKLEMKKLLARIKLKEKKLSNMKQSKMPLSVMEPRIGKRKAFVIEN